MFNDKQWRGEELQKEGFEMRIFEFEYTIDRVNKNTETIKAKSLTTALLEFTNRYPNAEYIDYKEIKNETII